MSKLAKGYDINKTFVIKPLLVTGQTFTVTACTGVYTNSIISCNNNNTNIFLGDDEIIINSTNLTGNTFFVNDLFGSTLSASTYLGLPIDVFVTGGTYDNTNGIATLINNTGGTFNLSGFYVEDNEFNFSLNFIDPDEYPIILPYNWRINSVDNISSISFTITLNTLPYSLGSDISGFTDTIVVSASTSGFLNLKCLKL